MTITDAGDGQPAMSEGDVDALLQSIENSPAKEIPMHDAAPAQSQTPQTPAPTAAPEYEITWNGKAIKAPIDKITQWASQGYDYAQKMGEFNKSRTEYEARQKALSEMEGRYKPIDEYVRQNPEWWNHVTQSFESRAQAGGADPVMSKVQEILQSKLQPIEQYIQSQSNKEQAQQREAEDGRLKSDISSIREQYKDLDFDTADDTGKSLEYKVLEYAAQNGINSFKTAFRDFHHDTLLKLAEERGKQQVVKDTQKRTKLGLLGSTQAPTKQLTAATDVKAKSYDALYQEALQELGIA